MEKLDNIKVIATDAKSEAKEARKELNQGLKDLNDKVDNHYASKSSLDDLRKDFEKYKEDQEKIIKVTPQEFWPVKTLVYGFTAVILLAVVGAIVALVVTQK